MRRTLLQSGLIVFLATGVVPALADTAAFDKGMEPVLDSYLSIHDALASDRYAGTAEHARAVAAAAARLDPSGVTGEHARDYTDLPEKIKASAAKVADAKDLESARDAYKELSEPMAAWAMMSRPQGVNIVFCSMAKGRWLQKDEGIRNPYYGSSMLRCGELVSAEPEE